MCDKPKIVTTGGYYAIFWPGHRLAMRNGYVYEHRLVAEESLGRPLAKDEQVHHLDGNKLNNAPTNLEVLTDAEHRLRHRKTSNLRLPGEANCQVTCACGCGNSFAKFDSVGRPRQYVSGHNARRR